MSSLGGADFVESTVSGSDLGPPPAARTRYPSPGFTLRNRRPPSSFARLVRTVFPALSRSDIRAPASSPVT